MRWSLLVCLASLAVFLLVDVDYRSMIDLGVYRHEGFALRHGIDIYGPIGARYDLRATYPPFAVLCFTVLTVFPHLPLLILSALGNVALLVVAIELSRRLIARYSGPIPACAVPLLTAVAVWCEPVHTTVHYGQVNLLIMVLVLWDLGRPAHSRGHGVALGIATGLKITPALFVVYLLLTGRVRSAVRASVAFLATVAVGALVRPHDTWRFWTGLVFDTGRVGNMANPANQSLRGVLTRAAGTFHLGWPAMLLVAAVGVFGLGCSVHAFRVRGEAWGLCTAAVTGLLVSPISWAHHWVWCVPIALLLWASPWTSGRGQRFWVRAAVLVPLLVFVSYGPSVLKSDRVANLQMSAGQQLISLPFVAFGLYFMAISLVRWRGELSPECTRRCSPAPSRSSPAPHPMRTRGR